MAEQKKGNGKQTTPTDAGPGAGKAEQENQSNENPQALAADPHIHVPGQNKAMRGPSQDDLNPAYAPPPAPSDE